MTWPVTPQAQTDLMREDSETTLPIGWRLLAETGTDALHGCGPGRDNPLHGMPDDLRRLLQAHAGDDDEVGTGVERLGVEDRQTLPGTVQRAMMRLKRNALRHVLKTAGISRQELRGERGGLTEALRGAMPALPDRPAFLRQSPRTTGSSERFPHVPAARGRNGTGVAAPKLPAWADGAAREVAARATHENGRCRPDRSRRQALARHRPGVLRRAAELGGEEGGRTTGRPTRMGPRSGGRTRATGSRGPSGPQPGLTTSPDPDATNRLQRDAAHDDSTRTG